MSFCENDGPLVHLLPSYEQCVTIERDTYWKSMLVSSHKLLDICNSSIAIDMW